MKRVNNKKSKRRLTLLFIIFLSLLTIFISGAFSDLSKIYNNIKATKKYSRDYEEKMDEEEKLKAEIEKLHDPEYVAKYAREKFLYSKDGELIIKIK